MVEVKSLSFGETFGYKGLMDVKSLYKMIDKWFKDHGYDKVELNNYDEVYEDGKQLRLKLRPFKKISDYAKVEIQVEAVLSKCQEVVVTKDKVKLKLMKGDAKFKFDTFLTTDYEGSWESKPLYFFFKTIAEKFLYRSVIDQYEQQALRDKDELKREIKSFLNMERFR